MKTCRRCQIEKPLNRFSKHKGRKDGLSSECKECANARGSAYYYANRASRLEYVHKNRDRRNANAAEWRRNHPFYATAKCNEQRAKDAGVESLGFEAMEYYLSLVREVYDACLICGETENLHFDHVVPISRGGHDVPMNIQVLCSHCNLSKRDSHVDFRKSNIEFLEALPIDYGSGIVVDKTQ